MSTNEAKVGANGNVETNNASPADITKLIDSLKEPGAPVLERCKTFHCISMKLNVDENPPIEQAVNAGLIEVLISLLSKTPTDWIFELLSGRSTPSNDGDEGISNKLSTTSIWLPPLLELITQTQMRAAWAASKVVECGFRDEAINQGLLETLTRFQCRGRSRKLWNYTMGAVADFFSEDLPLPDLDAARPAIRFLAISLNCNSISLNSESEVWVGAYDAIWAFTEMAERGNPEYIQELMNARIVDIFFWLIGDLIQEADGNNSPMWIKLTACIAFLIMRSHGDEHLQSFFDAGIVSFSMGFLRGDLIPGNDSGSWKNVTSWIAHIMLDSGMDEHRSAFVDAGIVDLLPVLLQHDLHGARLNGCLIVLSLARSRDDTFMTLLLEKGCVKWVFESASTFDEQVAELRPSAIDALAQLCISGSDDIVRELISKGYHIPLTDALADGDLIDRESPEVQEFWTEAVVRVRSLTPPRSKWSQACHMIMQYLCWLTYSRSS